MKKILILSSNPRNDLKLDREIKDLKNVIKRAKNQSQFQTEFELEVYPEELQGYFLEHEPRIVHFCGHGTGEQGLVLQDREGREQVVSTEALSNLFALFDKQVECVLLNACYSEVQANEIVQHINYVIGMSHEIRDDAAIAFATGFYRALGWGKSIEEAYEFGRNAIQIQIAKANTSRSRTSETNRKMIAVDITEPIIIPEDLKPVLKKKPHLTSFPEKIISPDSVEEPDLSIPSNVPPELIAALEEEERYKQYRERTRETWDEFGQANLAGRKPISKNEYRQRKTLLNKVQQFWIEGFLKPSLYANTAINLDLQNNPDAVLRPFEGLEDIPIDLDESFEGLQPTQILNQTELGKTLLILGDPGSGKTITLLQLAQKLVKQTEQDLTKPIPVVFNLSSWGQKQQPIENWLIEELKDKYQVPHRWSKPWIEQEQLILLLDGLDEVRADQRNACVRALNQFVETHNVTEMVVCSRVKDYEALTERLQLSSAISIKPLSQQQVFSFLTQAGNSLAGLKTLLQRDGELAQFAQTPLILNVMSLAYRGWSAKKLLQQFRTNEDRYRHLFDTYIDCMLRRRVMGRTEQNPNEIKYPQEKVLHWLSWLAKTMVDESKIIFLIEKMQPTLLESQREKINYRIGSFILSFILGLIIVGFFGLIVVRVTNPLYFGSNDSKYEEFTKDSIYYLTLVFATFSGIGFLINYGLTFGILKRELREIKLYEKLKWSLKKARFAIIKKVFLGSIVGLLYGLIYGLLMKHVGKHSIKLEGEIVIYVLILGLIFVLTTGWLSLNIQQRIFPNQGIKNSVKNSNWIGLIQGLLICFFYGIIAATLYRPPDVDDRIILIYNLAYGLYFGSIAGFIFWVRYGGSSFIEHFSLRRILYRKGRIPWNYARFLDYATDRLLMKKVGGGYVFYHRMLMEHFARRNRVSRELAPVTPRETLQPIVRTNTRTTVNSDNFNRTVNTTTVPRSSNAVQDRLVCGKCGHQNRANGKFCSQCGSKLTTS